MSALAVARDLSPNAQHYVGLLREAYALKLVDALAALEQAAKEADIARSYCSQAHIQHCEIDVLDARVEVFRIMQQLELDARIIGEEMA